MEIISALDAKNQFGHLLNIVQANPVQINKHGRAVAYVISALEYKKLQALHKKHLEEAILKANQEEAEDEEYQKELLSWEITSNDGLNE